MKKILFILALLPGLAFGAAKTWLGTTSASAKTVANWYGGDFPVNNVDTILFLAAYNNPCDFDSSFGVHSIRSEAGYTATVTNKNLKTLQLQKITLAGAMTFTVETAAPFLILPQSSGDAWSISPTATLNGAGTWSFRTNANSITSTLSALPLAMTSGYTTNASPSRNNTIIQYTGNVPSVENFNEYNSRSGITMTIKHGSYTHNITGTWNINLSAGAILIDSLQTSIWNVGGNITVINAGTLALEGGAAAVNLVGTGAQTVTSVGVIWPNITINNIGTATVKTADSLRCNDLTIIDGRDSIGRLYVAGNYTNTSNDSVIHYDTTIIGGSFLRNNAKTFRSGGAMSFRGVNNGTLTLQDAGAMGRVTIRKSVPSATMTAATNLRAGKILDSIGALKMLSYSLQCTTLTSYSSGLQCAAVTLDTLNSYASDTTSGGTITRWNWLANGLSHVQTALSSLAVTSLNGFGGSVGALDTMRSGTTGQRCTLDLAGDTITVDYAYIRDVVVVNGLIIATASGNVNGGNTNGITWASKKRLFFFWRGGGK